MDFGDQLSIFGDLFADPVVPSVKTKAQKKPDKKEQNKKAGKKVQLPVTINLLGFKPFTCFMVCEIDYSHSRLPHICLKN